MVHHRVKVRTSAHIQATSKTKRFFKLACLVVVLTTIIFTLHLGKEKLGSVTLETMLYAVCDRIAENLFFS